MAPREDTPRPAPTSGEAVLYDRPPRPVKDYGHFATRGGGAAPRPAVARSAVRDDLGGMTAPLLESVTLNDGARMPVLGLGVYQSKPGGETRQAVRWALELGYRHVDTARAYGNERDVAAAIAESGVPRAEVFVTTKLWNSDQGYDAALKAFDQSEKRLGGARIDLYLIHFPVERVRRDSWRALARLHQEGRVRSVGVSNYTVRHLRELMGESPLVPAVNQVEFHPFLYQRELLQLCREKGIVLEAYAPLVQARRMDHPVVRRVAAAHGRTPAQVLLRWCLQHGAVVIPKSVHRERIEENARIFDFSLGAEEMAALDGLDEGLRTSWDPSGVP
jgi:diketogulonate reductase-like aldo/keto reductase